MRGSLCWLGAPQSGGRGAPAALRCVHFVLCHLKHQRARGRVTCGVNDCGVTFPAGPGDPAPDRGRRRRGRRPLPGIGAPAATPRSWRWGMWAEGSARAEPASPPWSPGRAAAPGRAQDLWGQQPPLPLSRPATVQQPNPSRAHALRAACPRKAPTPSRGPRTAGRTGSCDESSLSGGASGASRLPGAARPERPALSAVRTHAAVVPGVDSDPSRDGAARRQRPGPHAERTRAPPGPGPWGGRGRCGRDADVNGAVGGPFLSRVPAQR